MLTLRQWRRAKDISQEYMASRLGVHLNTYQNWEKDPGKISITNAAKIVDILEVSPDEISFEQDPDAEVAT